MVFWFDECESNQESQNNEVILTHLTKDEGYARSNQSYRLFCLLRLSRGLQKKQQWLRIETNERILVK